jgi:hypothetical protein
MQGDRWPRFVRHVVQRRVDSRLAEFSDQPPHVFAKPLHRFVEGGGIGACVVRPRVPKQQGLELS